MAATKLGRPGARRAIQNDARLSFAKYEQGSLSTGHKKDSGKKTKKKKKTSRLSRGTWVSDESVMKPGNQAPAGKTVFMIARWTWAFANKRLAFGGLIKTRLY